MSNPTGGGDGSLACLRPSREDWNEGFGGFLESVIANTPQDPGDLYEFICDTSVQPSAIQTFETVSLRCQYERKFNKSHDHATESELQQFVFT